MINTLDSLAGLMKMDTTICALATPPGTGAIAVIRVSGKNTFSILEKIFIPTGKRLRVSDMSSHTVHLGRIVDGDEMIDEVLLTIFRFKILHGSGCGRNFLSRVAIYSIFYFDFINEERSHNG